MESNRQYILLNFWNPISKLNIFENFVKENEFPEPKEYEFPEPREYEFPEPKKYEV